MVLEVIFMWNRKRSVSLSIVVCFIFTGILTLGLFLGPWAITKWFVAYRGFNAGLRAIKAILTIFCACFYPCAAFAYITLYSLLRLLFNIRKDEIFITANVKYLRRISWCCFAVAFITFVGGFFYIPLLFIAVAAAFVGLMLRIVKNVMQNAVEIKAENELTI
jgi:Zn-dependent protease